MTHGIDSPQTRPWARKGDGFGQLSLVEHALCPLDTRSSLQPNLTFDAAYFYTDSLRRRQTATAKVLSPLGLSADDEFYLWGLLALTFSQSQPDAEFHATPHYCLRQLGVIDQNARRGGRQYRHFAEAIERLSAVSYRNDHFYDPVRAEHRKVSFGFLSYSLPLESGSTRAWRIVWDSIFYEFVAASGGHFRFDIATYRELDPASRRLFLFVSKVFARRETTPRLHLRHLGESVLGFSRSLRAPDLKLKVERVIARLIAIGVVLPEDSSLRKDKPGEYSLILTRGPYFSRRSSGSPGPGSPESPLVEPLLEIGFDSAAANRLIRQFPHVALREWTDITLAAKERFGVGFFSRSPQAYLVDNLKAAASGERMPPDWWHDVRKAELAHAGQRAVGVLATMEPPTSDADHLKRDSHDAFEKVRSELFGEFLRNGHSPAGARGMAQRFATEHFVRRTPTTTAGFTKLGSLIRTPSKR